MVPQIPKPRRVLLAVTLATIAIFGGLIAAITLRLRAELRAEVLQREAETIHAVALMQLDREGDEGRLAEFGTEFVIDDLFAAMLKSARFGGVLAVHLFDANGVLRKWSSVPPDDAASSAWWPRELAHPEARFIRDGRLEMADPKAAVEQIQRGATARLPLLDIAVPLQAAAGSSVVAVARYWIDGTKVQKEFAKMDLGLAAQAGIAFLSGAVLVSAVLAWSFARLNEANRRLVEQSADLARANQELDFAAKTGALGAISAHLIHGLKNPLAGIEGFVFETVIGDPDGARGDACRQAIETTKRLRALVSEITTVLRDETDGAGDYPVPVGEILEAARRRALTAADQAGIGLSVTDRRAPGAEVGARVANLAGLVLANLITNAIEASPRGRSITIEAQSANGNVDFIVRDFGSGIPAEVQSELFRPVRSTKRGGGGMGLAISLRLAKHAGGNLELVRSDRHGTEFRLSVPARVVKA